MSDDITCTKSASSQFASQSKPPGTYIGPSLSLSLSSSPFLFFLALFLNAFPCGLALYLDLYIRNLSLLLRRRLQKGETFSSILLEREIREHAPSLKRETAIAQAMSTLSFLRKSSFGQSFHTVACKDSFAFCVYPSRHFFRRAGMACRLCQNAFLVIFPF